jgi:coenzyme F420-0:L-glutamate ligase/coenzyme F420-1:gamma-L-glutamate ligase
MQLTLTPLPGIPVIKPGDHLGEIILEGLARAEIVLLEGDILVLAQKIVSKAEGRFVSLSQITPSKEAIELAISTDKDPRLVELILRESNEVLRKRRGTIIVEHRLGFVCASAGIDHSNVQPGVVEDSLGKETVLLLPENPDASARRLMNYLEDETGVGLGVLIIDSHGRAWRLGTVGITIGIAGVPGVVDLRGQPDLFDYRLQITEIGAADELAAAASLMMGQASEGTPIVHARGFPYRLRESSLNELLRPKEMDLFR